MKKRILALALMFTLIFSSSSSLYAQSYVVQEGDVLWSIAQSNGTTWENLADINKLEDPNFIEVGQVLEITEVDDTIVAEKNESVDITILSTSDMHGNIMGYVYEDEKYSDTDGILRISTYINEVREENPNVILVDVGDTIQGNILTDDILAKNLDKPNSVIQVMNYMGYDSMALGNHEFNFGLGVVEKVEAEADFAVLAANLYRDGERLGKPYTIVEKEGVRIAIIGLTNPNILKWDGDKLGGVTTTGIEEELTEQIAYLDANEDYDLLFVTAHVSETSEFYDGTNRDAGLGAIDAYPELELLILGHAHKTVNYVEGNTIVVATNNNARQVARTDITLENLDGTWTVANKATEIVSIEDAEIDENVVAMVKDVHEETINYIKGAPADGEEGDITPIVISTEKFQPENEIAGLPQGKLQDTAVIDLINNVQLDITGADVSTAALFKDTSDLPEGNITYGNIFDIYKFANIIYKVEISGAQLKQYMEWSAKHYNTAVEGDISASFNPDVPGYLYDMFQGVDYKIDISKPVGERIVFLEFKGEEVKADDTFMLAVNNYRFSGLTSEGIITNDPVWTSPLSVRDYIKAYMESAETISPTVDNNWELIGIDYDNPRRAEILAEINAIISDETTTDDRYDKSTFYNKSINVSDFE